MDLKFKLGEIDNKPTQSLVIKGALMENKVG